MGVGDMTFAGALLRWTSRRVANGRERPHLPRLNLELGTAPYELGFPDMMTTMLLFDKVRTELVDGNEMPGSGCREVGYGWSMRCQSRMSLGPILAYTV